MKKIVVFTGAGVSAESGLKTFRESGGLWEEYNVMDVATPDAWKKDHQLVLQFYNKRRKQVMEAKPNEAHIAIARLQKKFDVHVITQNIDDLHERAGSQKVLHLHGEITKSRSTLDPNLIYDIKGWELNIGDLCDKKSQLRPHIVWFGEMVPNMETAYQITAEADVFVVLGTSLYVYPAAGLIDYAPEGIPKYLIDPNETKADGMSDITVIKETAGIAMKRLAEELME